MLKKAIHALAILLLAVAVSSRDPRAQLSGSYIANGSGSPSGACINGSVYIEASNGHIWTCSGTAWTDTSAAASGPPSGFIGMIASGSCPSGYGEVSALSGSMPYGTVAANGDVGGTGGANSITPTIATLTAAAQVITWPVSVPAFTGAALAATTFAIPTGSGSFKGSSTGGFSTVGAAAPGSTGATTSKSPGTPAGTVAWPASVPTNAGSNVTGTLSSFDNRPSFVKVIFCSKS